MRKEAAIKRSFHHPDYNGTRNLKGGKRPGEPEEIKVYASMNTTDRVEPSDIVLCKEQLYKTAIVKKTGEPCKILRAFRIGDDWFFDIKYGNAMTEHKVHEARLERFVL